MSNGASSSVSKRHLPRYSERLLEGASTKAMQKPVSPFLVIPAITYNKCLRIDAHMERFQSLGHMIHPGVMDLLDWNQEIIPVEGKILFYKLAPADLGLLNTDKPAHILEKAAKLDFWPCYPWDPFKIIENSKLSCGEYEMITHPMVSKSTPGCHLSIKPLGGGRLLANLMSLCKPHRGEREFFFRREISGAFAY